MEMAKIFARVCTPRGNYWEHFSYVPKDLKKKFDKLVNKGTLPINDWMSKWAEEDFGIVKLESKDDFDNLRAKIKEQFKETYPELYVDSPIDNQGWNRVWFVNHMKKELEKIED